MYNKTPFGSNIYVYLVVTSNEKRCYTQLRQRHRASSSSYPVGSEGEGENYLMIRGRVHFETVSRMLC